MVSHVSFVSRCMKLTRVTLTGSAGHRPSVMLTRSKNMISKDSKGVMVFCKDCKHSDFKYSDVVTVKCKNPKSNGWEISLVTGEMIINDLIDSQCESARERGRCGPSGVLFEQKPPTILNKLASLIRFQKT